MNPRNEAKIQNKTGWKKFTGKNFKSQKKRLYRNRRKMNQKASKHSRLFEERERKTRLLESYLRRERERALCRGIEKGKYNIIKMGYKFL